MYYTMSDHFISWPDTLSTHLKIVIFVTGWALNQVKLNPESLRIQILAHYQSAAVFVSFLVTK